MEYHKKDQNYILGVIIILQVMICLQEQNYIPKVHKIPVAQNAQKDAVISIPVYAKIADKMNIKGKYQVKKIVGVKVNLKFQ